MSIEGGDLISVAGGIFRKYIIKLLEDNVRDSSISALRGFVFHVLVA